jgi:hypothetical protein
VGLQGNPAQLYDLTKGQYSVEITVGKSFATQREENQEMLRSIIESAPGLTPMLADLLIEQIDTPIARRAAERLRKMNPAAKDDDEGQPQIPPEVQAQLKAMTEQNQQLTEALKQQTEELKANRYKVDAEVAIVKMEIASREKIAGLTAQTQAETAAVKTESAEEIAKLQAATDLREKKLTIAADLQQQEDKQKHERSLATAEFVREERGRDHERQMSEAEMMAQTRERRETEGHEREMTNTKAGHELVNAALKDTRKQKFDFYQGERDRAVQTDEADRDRQQERLENERSRQYESERQQAQMKPKPKPKSKPTKEA